MASYKYAFLRRVISKNEQTLDNQLNSISVRGDIEKLARTFANNGLETFLIPSSRIEYRDLKIASLVLITKSCLIFLSAPDTNTKLIQLELCSYLSRHFAPEDIYYLRDDEMFYGLDILQIHNYFFCNLSFKSNSKGFHRVKHILNKYGYFVDLIRTKKPSTFHIKNHAFYLRKEIVILDNEIKDDQVFDPYLKVLISNQKNEISNLIYSNEILFSGQNLFEIKNFIHRHGLDVKFLEINHLQAKNINLNELVVFL